MRHIYDIVFIVYKFYSVDIVLRKTTIFISSALFLATQVGFAIDKELEKTKKATGINVPVSKWKVPDAINEEGYIDESKMPKDSEYSKLVILGNKIINETAKYAGPQAKNPKDRYAGNNLSCSSCHGNGGTNPNQSAFVGIYGRFPQYNARADKVISLEDRINGCFERSMNGRRLDNNAWQMRAMMAYMQWLSQGVPVGGNIEGQGLIKIGYLDRAADPKKGAHIYAEKCSACHGEKGEGMKNDGDGPYYMFPPLWGKDSYNTGAGMYRLIKAASYIKANMPKGDATLTEEEAYDVAAFINSQKRPVKPHRDKDFPDRRVKPLDMDVGPYDPAEKGRFSEKDHRYGPYGPMEKK